MKAVISKKKATDLFLYKSVVHKGPYSMASPRSLGPWVQLGLGTMKIVVRKGSDSIVIFTSVPNYLKLVVLEQTDIIFFVSPSFHISIADPVRSFESWPNMSCLN